MARRNWRLFKKGQQLELQIEDLAFGGKGIAKVETDKGDFTVFVQNALPGQKVIGKVAKCKKQYAECKLMEVLSPSPDEVEIPYQEIPGAPYARLPLEKQIQLKKETTFELFKRIGGIENIKDLFDVFIESPSSWHYRNKMEYSFSAIRWDLKEECDKDDFALGFKHRGTWWKVENLDANSGLFDEDFENKLSEIRKFCEGSGLPAWHPPKREGFFRYLVVRKSYHSNQLLINLVTTDSGLDKFDIDGFIELIKTLFGDRVAGLIHTINNQTGDRVEPNSGDTGVLYGQSKVIEMINGLEFEISMSSFFQTNPKCAERLYSKVLEYASEAKDTDQYIFDLFCGTGTIAQLLAKGSKSKIVGVDIVESAIEDAKKNAARNQVTNVEFHAADVGKFLVKYPHYCGKISTIVLDPPRAGIAPKTLTKVIALDANRIVYVSCNPATQARDAKELLDKGYALKKISFADQFPHTSHLETIAVFEKVN